MKAIVLDGYGGTDRLQIRDMPDPKPAAGELLVRVRASSVNPVDWKLGEGELKLLFRLTFPYIPGGDIAGEVVEVGQGVTRFKPGDAVVAFVELKRGGGYAELAVVKESATALETNSLSFSEAATLPIAGCTALQALRDKGKLKAGQSVLITGGAGGVGHFAVQIAKAMGARTTATCGAANVEFVRSLGADRVIDYSRDDFTRLPDKFSLIFDAVGKSTFKACKPLLEPSGTYVTTLPGPGVFLQTAVQAITGLFGETRRATMVIAQPEGPDLAKLGALADEGKLKPVIGSTYPLDRARDAWKESKKGHTRGKIVLEI